MKILLIDNYDSFTFNLYHYISSLNSKVDVVRNDKINSIEIKKKNYEKENSNLIYDFLKGLNYENKNKVGELFNPINFFIWLVVSFKDIF